MSELVFEVTQEADGGYVAEALGESIFTQSDSWDALCANVREAVKRALAAFLPRFDLISLQRHTGWTSCASSFSRSERSCSRPRSSSRATG